MMKTNRIELPISVSGCGDIKIVFDGLTLVAEFEYRDSGVDYIGSIRFNDVLAHRFRNAMHSRGLDTGSYDSLVEISESLWLQQLREMAPDGSTDIEGKKHFAVFFSSNGYLEVVAQSAECLKTREGLFCEENGSTSLDAAGGAGVQFFQQKK